MQYIALAVVPLAFLSMGVRVKSMKNGSILTSLYLMQCTLASYPCLAFFSQESHIHPI